MNIMYFGMQGLGDHISANALVRTLAAQAVKVIVPVWGRYCSTIQYMYRDSEKIIVKPIISGQEIEGILNILQVEQPELSYIIGPDLKNDVKNKINKITSLKHHSFTELLEKYGDNNDCHQLYYLGAEIPFSKRFEDFYFERDLDREDTLFNSLGLNNEEYIFVHDDPARGYHIQLEDSNIKKVNNNYNNLIFDYGKIIENAKEVHCMESSFRCYIENLNPKGTLYLHHYVRKTTPFLFNNKLVENCSSKPWNLII